MLAAKSLIGTHNVLIITLDTLRYDVAVQGIKDNRTPQMAKFLPAGQWELRHSPGSFTYSAHQAFFAGFLPAPAAPGPHPRLFAATFPGSETTTESTFSFDAPDIVSGLAAHGYHTICIGGVGFFNKLSPLGSVLPDLFVESYWDETLGVTDRDSTKNQVDLAVQLIGQLSVDQRFLLFVNVSALHQPNCIYVGGASKDSTSTQLAALEYADGHLGRLFRACCQESATMCIVTSDHGTAYGEDGYWGHRLAHPVVWNVPYAEFVIESPRGP